MEKRIEQLIDALGITQTCFASDIGVNTATLSHIMSGRNKPSLELVLKILNKHKNINPDWLLTGNGEMYRSQQKEAGNSETKAPVHIECKNEPKPVKYITVFYDDNTYCTFYPK